MGAEQKSRGFAGGEAEGWHAYALGAASQSPVPWDEAALADYLARGFHPLHGAALSSMGLVVENLAAVPRADVEAMAHYLASLDGRTGVSRIEEIAKTKVAVPPGPGQLPQSAGAQAVTPDVGNRAGAALYAGACASCHEGGRPLPLGGIHFSLSIALSGESPSDLVNIVLQGVPAADGVAGPIMPGFADVISDAQLANLARFLRSRFTEKPAWTDIDAAIRAARATRQLALPSDAQVIP
jgi:mono/diheme cytochrome c family protein